MSFEKKLQEELNLLNIPKPRQMSSSDERLYNLVRFVYSHLLSFNQRLEKLEYDDDEDSPKEDQKRPLTPRSPRRKKN